MGADAHMEEGSTLEKVEVGDCASRVIDLDVRL